MQDVQANFEFLRFTPHSIGGRCAEAGGDELRQTNSTCGKSSCFVDDAARLHRIVGAHSQRLVRSPLRTIRCTAQAPPMRNSTRPAAPLRTTSSAALMSSS